MQRRGFIFGLGALAAGTTVTGAGAFETVSVERQVSVDITDDADAFLGIHPTSDYAVSDGQMRLDFTAGNDKSIGSGFHANSAAAMGDVFEIINQGDQTVEVALDPDDGFMNAYYEEVSDNGGYASLLVYPSSGNPLELAPGDSVSYAASMVVGNDPGEFGRSMTIEASEIESDDSLQAASVSSSESSGSNPPRHDLNSAPRDISELVKTANERIAEDYRSA